MVRFGLLAVLVGLLVWRLARPSPRGRAATGHAGWQRRGLRVAVVGLAVVYLLTLIRVGVL